jgi:hypothetical protein
MSAPYAPRSDLPSFTIGRHCVANGSEGLSPLQGIMLNDEPPVRILSAPTGAGKSYAFQRAVIERGARVLFVVPTRRLAQNLAAAVLEDLAREGVADAEGRVVIWTSDERRKQKEVDPTLRIGRYRIRQLRGDETPSGGCIIIATPESVGWLLMRPGRNAPGVPVMFVDKLLRDVDHVVFDEFHTIDARGFGLAAMLASITARVEGGAKVTFLSATPIDILPVLKAFCVPEEKMRIASETVVTGAAYATPGMRALHGDVVFDFVYASTMIEILTSKADAVRDCLSRNRQVVVIYDSLEALNREKKRLAKWCDAIGLPLSVRLAINSSDDSAGAGDDGLFSIGRNADPLEYSFLVATSSVEIGVTFRAGMLLMDPGFDASSFVQRAGRVARGDEPGRVIVRINTGTLDRKPWLRALCSELPRDGAMIDIDRFVAAVLRLAVARFDTPGRGANEAAQDLASEAEMPTAFATLPRRAVWCAALFWAVLHRSGHLYWGQRQTLAAFAPKPSRLILALLVALDRLGLRSTKVWVAAFQNEALRFRDIAASVDIEDASGHRRTVPWRTYAAYSGFHDAPAVFDTRDGRERLVVYLDGRISDVISEGTPRRVTETVETLFPHETVRRSFPREQLVAEWLRYARDQRGHAILRDPRQEDALDVAIRLVGLTGLAPMPDDGSTPDAQASAIL